MTPPVTPWWEALEVRPEIVRTLGSIDDVQMSLFDAVYPTADQPLYAKPRYYGEITHPSPNFSSLMAQVAVRLAGGDDYTRAPALWWLDQNMGGGKSHGLIGLYHLATDPRALADTDVGHATFDLAGQIVGRPLPADLNAPICVVLAADNMTPGTPIREQDGPAQTLYERFLWRLFRGNYDHYQLYQDHYSDKSKIVEALRLAGRPVLILIDEIMNYVRQLSMQALGDLEIKDMAFLRVLLDAVNDVPHVAMVVVMIRSGADDMQLDSTGQERRAELEQLLRRNGKTATVNDNTDFAAILRRRLFTNSAPDEAVSATAGLYADHMTGSWRSKVFDQLAVRWVQEWRAEVARSYPFHPQLIALAEQEWANLSGFQRVRSTIRIFAAAVHALAERGSTGQWAPLLINIGDLPLSITAVKESVLSSGLIIDTRAQSNYRNIANTDIVTVDDTSGSARNLDLDRQGSPYARTNPRAAERSATALFLTSIVSSRADGKQGASEPELKAASFVPDSSYTSTDADGVLSELKDVDGRGLAAVEAIPGRRGQPPRLFLSTTQTLNMLVRAARQSVTDEDRDEEIAKVAKRITNTGSFKDKLFVTAEVHSAPRPTPREVLETAGIDDARSTRLVVLDPRYFTLSNGADEETRRGIRAAMGLGDDRMPMQWASSAVFAVANTHRRSLARGAATEYLSWGRVAAMVDVRADLELQQQAKDKLEDAKKALDTAVRRTYQHIFYLGMGDKEDLRREHSITLEHSNQSALDGTGVWTRLVEADKALGPGTFDGRALLHNLRDDDYGRPLDELRDLFWNSPRMPLLPNGERDLQEAIFDAVDKGAILLVGADGEDRAVGSPTEIGVGQAGLRLARPQVAPARGDAVADDPGQTADPDSSTTAGADGGDSTKSSTGNNGEDGESQEAEVEVAFSGMVSLRDDERRNALRLLLLKVADRVDDGDASYMEVLLKVRVGQKAGKEIGDLAREAGVRPTMRDV
ncbi:DUF499 domain-containing protein [Micromonospora sp. DT53]